MSAAPVRPLRHARQTRLSRVHAVKLCPSAASAAARQVQARLLADPYVPALPLDAVCPLSRCERAEEALGVCYEGGDLNVNVCDADKPFEKFECLDLH